MNNKKLKDKLLNYIFSDGQKKTSEKIIKKTFKSIQKSQKKSHKDIIKLAIINSTPTFRIIKLKNKKKRKKNDKRYPGIFINI
jgi:ribosomal protein S7